MSRSVAEIPPSETREMSEANRGRRDNAVTGHHAVPARTCILRLHWCPLRGQAHELGVRRSFGLVRLSERYWRQSTRNTSVARRAEGAGETNRKERCRDIRTINLLAPDLFPCLGRTSTRLRAPSPMNTTDPKCSPHHPRRDSHGAAAAHR
jgi:hypothetical protein